MGWISNRHMRSGGSIGGRVGKHKGPLRKIVRVLRFGSGLFDTDQVEMECNHNGPARIGAKRARCAECGKAEPDKYSGQPFKKATRRVGFLSDEGGKS